MIKKIISLLLLVSMTLPLAAAFAQSTDILVFIDGSRVNFPDQKPFIDGNGRTLVPVRFVSQELGATVDWLEADRMVTITFAREVIYLTVNSNLAYKIADGTQTQILIDSIPLLRNGRVFVPLRFISEAMGRKVDWDQATQSVIITKPITFSPNRQLLDFNHSLDNRAFTRARMEQQDGYMMIKQWPQNQPFITSIGDYQSLAMAIDLQTMGDYFYLEYGSTGEADVAWASLYFSADEHNNHHFFYDLTPDMLNGTKQVPISRASFQIGAGSPEWEEVKYFRMAFQSRSGRIATLRPELLATYNAKAYVTISFDDGWEDNYTKAFSIMQNIYPSLPASLAIVPTFIGTDSYLSPAQLEELTAAGWEIYNHSYTHPFLTDLNPQEIETELLNAFNYVSRFDPLGAYHHAVPYSAVNQDVLSVSRQHMLSTRYVANYLNPMPFDRHRIGFMEVTNTTSFEEVQQWIDQTIEEKKWIVLMFHRVDDPADNRYTYTTGEFAKIVMYLKLKKQSIEAITFSQALKETGYILTLGN